MRKIVFILLLIGLWINAKGQYIQSMSTIPSNPSDNTPVSVIVDEYFPSAGCNLDSKSVAFNGNNINASSIHCLGILTVICANSDTFHLGLLNPGTYTFIMNLKSVLGPSPCSGSPGAAVVDTFIFTVSSATSVLNKRNVDANFFYNPTDQKIQIEAGMANQLFEIWDLSGQLIHRNVISKQNYTFECHNLRPSTYLAILRNEYQRRLLKFRIFTN